MDKAKNKKLFENVYRTRDYIVKQELYLIVNAVLFDASAPVGHHHFHSLRDVMSYFGNLALAKKDSHRIIINKVLHINRYYN